MPYTRLNIIFLASLLLAACVPTPFFTAIYEPSSRHGKLLDSQCGYNSGPGIWDKLELDIDGNKLYVRADKSNNGSFKLVTTFYAKSSIPTDIIKWESNSLVVIPNENIKSISGPYYLQNNNKKRNIELTSEVEVNNLWYRNQYFIYDVIRSTDDNFSIKLPSLYINNKKYEIPVISFKPSTSWYFVTINC